MKTVTIAVDAMGGDHGPSVILPAVLQVIAKHPQLHLVLVGDEEVLRTHLPATLPSQLTLHHASQRVEMDESPSQALRSKKDSSMRVAINLVKEGVADACVSAGNTGALMATARFVLKTLPGIDRPAIISKFPTIDEHKVVRLLDLGANVDATPDILFQFAVMGSVLVACTENNDAPRVCLLNIGEEDIKGNELVKQTAQLLAASTLNYQGYIEGNELFKCKADVVVCDGFVGNVTLKTTEGVAIFIVKLLKEAFNRNLLTKLAGLISMPVLRAMKKRINPDRYNGATLIGLQGVVIKSHGGANSCAFANAIEEAVVQVEKNVLERISSEIERILKLPS